MTKISILFALLGVLTAIPSSYAAVEVSTDKEEDTENLKNFDIQANPLGLLGGVYSASLGVGIARSITIGPAVTGYHTSGHASLLDYRGYRAGVRSSFYLSGPRFSGGWVVSPELGFADFTLVNSFTDPGQTYTTDHYGSYVGFEGVYRWAFPSGINVSLGGVLRKYGLPIPVVPIRRSILGNSTNPGLSPSLVVSAGYSF